MSTPERAELLHDSNIPRTILRLGWPVVVSHVMHTAFHLANIAWVGRLGPGPLAAIGTAVFASWILFSLADLVCIGVTAHVARRIGEGRRELAGESAVQAISLAGALSLLLGAAGLLGAGPLFRALGTEPGVADAAATYTRITFAGSAVILVAYTCEAILRASGDTRTPMKIIAAALLLNAVLDPLFILGPGPFPRWGLAGAAGTTIAVHLGGMLLLLRHLRHHPEKVPVRWDRLLHPDRAMWRSLVRVGSPPALTGILFSVVYLALSRITAQFGTPAVAALALGNRLESISFLTAAGFGAAAATLVGQSLGAGLPERAERCAWNAAALIAVFTGLYGLVMCLFPAALARVFTGDPEVVAAAAANIRILGLCQVFVGLEVVIDDAFGGAGDTLPTTLISLPVSLLRIPLSWAVAVPLGFGPEGVWWTLTITCVARALFKMYWFRRNRWMRKALP